MLEFNFILDNLREYVAILDCANDIKFRYVNEQFLRHFSHAIVPSANEQIFSPIDRIVRRDPRMNELTIWDRVCCCFRRQRREFVDNEPDLEMASN